jgi:hypothetical protein
MYLPLLSAPFLALPNLATATKCSPLPSRCAITRLDRLPNYPMPTYSLATELLEPGETALCLFTNGEYFTISDKGTGSSGYWPINPQRPFDRIIIFHWSDAAGQRHVDLFTALSAGFEGPVTDGKYEGRYTVKLQQLAKVGTTDSTYEQFASAAGPWATYVTRPKDA